MFDHLVIVTVLALLLPAAHGLVLPSLATRTLSRARVPLMAPAEEGCTTRASHGMWLWHQAPISILYNCE